MHECILNSCLITTQSQSDAPILAHLFQVSPVRGAAAPLGAAGTPFSPHDSCARPHRLRWPPIRAPTRSKRVRRTSRLGIFLGTLLHLPAGSFSLRCNGLVSPGSKLGDSVDSGRHRGFEHLTKRSVPTFKKNHIMWAGAGRFEPRGSFPGRELQTAVCLSVCLFPCLSVCLS